MPRLRERYSLAQFQQRFAPEEACLDHLEQARWPHGPVCPHCGVIGESSRLTARPRVRQCTACRKQRPQKDCRKSVSPLSLLT